MSKLSKEEYNSIPVSYCQKCLSLKVINLVGIEDFDFCDECGSTNIESDNIETWRKLYRKRYGFDYTKSNLK